MFTDPQIAMVGHGWRGAQAVEHVVGEVSFEDQGRARVMLRNQGLLHVYAEVGTGRFLGAEMIGPDAEHIAHLLAWALQMNCTIAQMLEMPFYHPVVEEGLRTGAARHAGEARRRRVAGAPRRLTPGSTAESGDCPVAGSGRGDSMVAASRAGISRREPRLRGAAASRRATHNRFHHTKRRVRIAVNRASCG